MKLLESEGIYVVVVSMLILPHHWKLELKHNRIGCLHTVMLHKSQDALRVLQHCQRILFP
jgi:hypothetical protein